MNCEDMITLQRSIPSAGRTLYNYRRTLYDSYIFAQRADEMGAGGESEQKQSEESGFKSCSQKIQCTAFFSLEFLEKGRRKARDFLKLTGQVGYTAIVEFVGDLGQGKLII